MDVVIDRIVEIERERLDRSLENQQYKKVTVEKFGANYDTPEEAQGPKSAIDNIDIAKN